MAPLAQPRQPEALPAEALSACCAPASLPFETTADLEPLTEPLGQERALAAATLAVEMDHAGYNLVVIGPSGFGKHAFVRSMLERVAASRETPGDFCYVYDFARRHRPRALRLPAGRGAELHSGMQKLVEDLRAAIPAAFESETYRSRLQEIEEEFKEHTEHAFSDVQREAMQQDISMVRLPNGIVFAPTRRGEVVSPEEFGRLSEAEQEQIKQRISALQERLARELRKLPEWGRQSREKVRALQREVSRSAIEHTIDELVRHFSDLSEVVAYLRAVEEDVVENADDFLRDKEDGGLPRWLLEGEPDRSFVRYQVNLLVDHSEAHGAPVVYADRPTVQELLGRIEQRAQLGNLVSDFTLIRPGALHRANGGFLMLDLRSLLVAQNSWEALKRALFAREIRIESLAQLLGLSGTSGLEPEPIPLDVKVVLIGNRLLYHLLNDIDSDVSELFKVVADFDDDVDREPASELNYARVIAGIVQREGLLPFDRAAVRRAIEQSARTAGDGRKLSTRMRWLEDLLREADHLAAQRGQALVGAADIRAAIDAHRHRRDRPLTRLREAVLRGTLLIDTSGSKLGQVNGLSVVEFGGFAFGHPTRVTATARVGEGKVIDIEREVELGGPIHSKGVLILSSWLAARYTRDLPLSLAASLVFEQSYSAVEGDSGSLAELCALLSALSGIPIKQSFAVTGSVNQLGEVQAIGGVNDKIEGFFEVCAARGLSGEQGVLIPQANVPHLMLREDVVAAARDGKFRILAVKNVDEAIELLTGVAAGERDEQGDYPDGTVNERVLATLLEFAVIGASFEKMVKVHVSEEGARRG